ncbi:MAG: ABC transporter permease [Clostridia bacterium]|jgi:putative ABC transport system permease protein|nr:ABC transporter permease [Clostridia bacterium]
MEILEGRFPKNFNELVISEAKNIISSDKSPTKIKVGENLTITLNGEKREYIIVGKVKNSEFDNTSLDFTGKVGAITHLDKSKISNNTIVSASVLTKNIQKIYKTCSKLEDNLDLKLNIEENEPQISEKEMLENALNGNKNTNILPSLEYNTELLNYECVIEGNSTFSKIMITATTFVIIILGFVSVKMIKNSFNISYLARIKELGMLSSIGMNKKQRNKVIAVETNILSFIAIIIGILLGILLSYTCIEILNKIICQMEIEAFLDIKNSEGIILRMPVIALFSITVIVWIIIKISSRVPLKKINKISPIQAIKSNINIKINKKQVRHPKLIEKLLGYEGVLAYKNIKRNKERLNTILGSLMISLLLFLSTSGFIANVEKLRVTEGEYLYNDYEIEISTKSNDIAIKTEKVDEIIKYLNDKKLIDKCYASIEPFFGTRLELKENQISDMANKIRNEGAMLAPVNQNGNLEVAIEQFLLVGDSYNEILKKAGVKELKENEVIITNSITEKTKYGNKIELTNLKVGDSYDVDIGQAVGKKDGKKETFVIARNSR